jgi:hypothetical protein
VATVAGVGYRIDTGSRGEHVAGADGGERG